MPVEDPRPPVPHRLLIDNSVWQRVRDPAVREQVDLLQARHPPWAILTCPPVVAEVGFSARSGEDHTVVMQSLSEFPDCGKHPSSEMVLQIQNDLFNGGLFRAVGAMDTIVAAYAIENDATVVHYDRDFEHVAAVRDDFRHHWILPRGRIS